MFFLITTGAAFSFEARVTKVTDGDTVSAVDQEGKTLKIRLFGIDAPEKTQDYGKNSQKALSGMVSRKEVDIETVAEDKYGRIVGIIRLGNKTVNEEMVRKGHAWVYGRYCKRSECGRWMELQEEARRDRRGLWKDSSPVPPWEYRHDKKDSSTDLLDVLIKLLK